MRAYFVHDSAKESDSIVVPELDMLVAVDREAFDLFISARPDFSRFSAVPAGGLSPRSFGKIVATRDDDGDVCVKNDVLWQQRMEAWLA